VFTANTKIENTFIFYCGCFTNSSWLKQKTDQLKVALIKKQAKTFAAC
jgi:hypothetical protein